jgi:hypothetical protein
MSCLVAKVGVAGFREGASDSNCEQRRCQHQHPQDNWIAGETTQTPNVRRNNRTEGLTANDIYIPPQRRQQVQTAHLWLRIRSQEREN